MTPLERAVAARHPSTYRSGVSDRPPVVEASAGSAAAAAGPMFSDFHATVTSITEAVGRLRALKDRKSSLASAPRLEVEAHRGPDRGATTQGERT